jgi:hypothetical protein
LALIERGDLFVLQRLYCVIVFVDRDSDNGSQNAEGYEENNGPCSDPEMTLWFLHRLRSSHSNTWRSLSMNAAAEQRAGLPALCPAG